MIEKAYGKINLSLDVVGKLENGYHELDMIMVPIDLFDIIEINLATKDTYQCNIDLPFDEHNIIYKAIEVLRSRFRFNEHFEIKVTKNIPMQAGLAGGSSDGAAVLRILNKLLKLDLSLEELANIGSTIGADVPYCVYSCCSRVKGFGEKVTPFKMKNHYDVLIIKPEKGINTKLAFERIDNIECIHPNVQALQEALQQGKQVEGLLGNSLYDAAVQFVPEIEQLILECKKQGYANTLMSGSGSACFVLLDKNQDEKSLISYLENKCDFIYKTKIL